jgi:hypothetical protein
MGKAFRGLGFCVVGIALFLMVPGCTRYRTGAEKMMTIYRQGQIDECCLLMDQPAMKDFCDKNEDRLIWLMERGKVLHDAGRYKESNLALIAADKLLDQYDQSAKVSVSQEATAAMLDQTTRTYMGTPADRILVSTYIAVNYFASGDFENARVYTRRSHDRQVEALQENAAQLEKAQKEWEKQVAKRPKAKPTTSPVVAPAIEQDDDEFKSWVSPAYADYANPMASYLSGVLSIATDDLTNARVDLQKTCAMVPENRFVQQDLNLLDQPRDDQTVFVLFENGMGPELKEKRYTYATPWTGVSVLALPNLSFNRCDVSAVQVTGGGITCQTERLASLNSILATEFKSRFKMILIRTITSLMVKEAATATGAEVGRQNNNVFVQLIFLIGGSIWKASTANSDLRMWRTLPAEIQLARCARPKDGVMQITLVTTNGVAGPTTTVQVPDTAASMILVRSVNSQHLRCTVSPLTPAEMMVSR